MTAQGGFKVLGALFPISRCRRARFFERKDRVAPGPKKSLWLLGNNKKARQSRAF
jgi:hypothetical protein